MGLQAFEAVNYQNNHQNKKTPVKRVERRFLSQKFEDQKFKKLKRMLVRLEMSGSHGIEYCIIQTVS